MAAKKARKRAYIPPSSEVVNRRERTSTPRSQRTTAAKSQRGGAAYAYPQPSLRRTLRRLPIYFLLIFALQYFIVGMEQEALSTSERLRFAASTAAFVTVLFAPFMHVMDRFAYNRYLKRTGQQAATPTSKSESKQD
jgi:hypothetical protein